MPAPFITTLLANISSLATTAGNALQLRGFKTGGTVGQVPVKTNGTDFNQGWADGDLIPVTATNSNTRRTLKSRAADVVCPLDFGAKGDGETNDSAAIQAAIDYIADLPETNRTRRIDFAGKVYAVGSTIFMRNARHLHLDNGTLVATDDFTTGSPMIEVKTSSTNGTVQLVLNANKRAAGIYIPSNSFRMFQCHVHSFREYGVYVTGGLNMQDCVVEEIQSNDTAFADQNNFLYDGIRCAASDVRLIDSNFRYCKVPMRFMEGCYTTRVINCHVWNGGGSDSVPLRDRPKNIVVESGCGTVDFLGCYLDNGEIDLYSHAVQFKSCQMLQNAERVTVDYCIGLYKRGGNSYNLDKFFATDWRLYNTSGFPFIEFLDNGDLTWNLEYDAIAADLRLKADHLAHGEWRMTSLGGDDEPFTFATPRQSSRIKFKHGSMDGKVKEVVSYQDYMIVKGGVQTVMFNEDEWRVVVKPTEMYPQTNDAMTLGKAGGRWSEVFSVNGTINTSDERYKQDIEELSEAEKRVAVTLKGLIRRYRLKSAVSKKGDAARIHVGIIAQQVKAAFEAEGLVAEAYGILCYDEWEAEPAVYEEEKCVKAAVPAGSSYGIRYEELLAFIIAAL